MSKNNKNFNYKNIISILILLCFGISTLLMYLWGNSHPTTKKEIYEYKEVEDGYVLTIDKTDSIFNHFKTYFKQDESMEFFSFFCSHCYDFEYKELSGVFLRARNSLDNNFNFKQYSVDFISSQHSPFFTQAFSLLEILLEENKIEETKHYQLKKAMFDLAQTEFGQKINSLKDLYDFVFKEEFSYEDFEKQIKEEKVQELIKKQHYLAQVLNVIATPSFYKISLNDENIIIKRIDFNARVFRKVKTEKEFIEVLLNSLR